MEKSIVEQINEKTDIVDLVSQFVDLSKKGKNYLGLCPFHQEKTPSFSVSPEKNICKCMSCGEGGNPINFYRKIKNIPRSQAISELGERLGLSVQKEVIKKDPFEKYYKLMAEVTQFYQFNLANSGKGQEALKYLYQRQMTDDLIKHFKIGYAPPFGNDVYRLLKDKGYQTTDMIDLGIIKQDQKGEYYDLFSDRVIFPITNKNGYVVGFSGRTLNPKDQVKYINSPETPIFKKGLLLYHYHEALSDVRKSKHTVLFEGFFDVISAFGAEIKNGVATMGTALTKDQAQLIKQVTDAVIICYDGDQAGLKATDQAITILEKERLKVNILIIPEQMDPDDFIKAYGPETFEKLFGDNLLDPFAFRYVYYKKASNLNDAHDIKTFKTNVLSMLRYADSSIQQFYVKKLAADLNVTEASLEIVKPQVDKKVNIPIKPKTHLGVVDRYTKAEIYLIMGMLKSKPVALAIKSKLKSTDTAEAINMHLRIQILNYYENNDILDIEAFLDQLDSKLRHHVETLIMKDLLWNDEKITEEKIIDEHIEVVKKAGLARRLQYIIKQLKEIDSSNQKRASLVIEKDEIQRQLKHTK